MCRLPCVFDRNTLPQEDDCNRLEAGFVQDYPDIVPWKTEVIGLGKRLFTEVVSKQGTVPVRPPHMGMRV